MHLKRLSAFLLSVFIAHGTSSQQLIAELRSKNHQRDFRAIPHGDSILLSWEEFVGANKTKVNQVKWITRDGKVENIFCPVNVFATTLSNGKIYYYYRDEKSLKAFSGEKGSRGMSSLSESIEFSETILASYIDDNLFFILLDQNGRDVSILEIEGMTIVKTRKYSLPISLNDFITKNTYIEFYDEPSLNSFQGRAGVKLFRYDAELFILIDDFSPAATKKKPNKTHVLHLTADGSVDYTTFSLEEKSDFGSFLMDGKLFQSVISREKFSLLVHDLSTQRQLMKEEIFSDSVGIGKKDSLKVVFRSGKENLLGWDTFRRTIRTSVPCDPLIVVSKNVDGYAIQWGTYLDDNGAGTFVGANPLAAMLTFFVTTAIRQVSEGPGISRYLYYQTDLSKGQLISADSPPPSLLRGKVDSYEISKQVKGKSPFDSKRYIPFGQGLVCIYSLKAEKAERVTQLIYFE